MHDILEGGSCGAVSNLHFAVKPQHFLGAAGHKVLSYASLSAFRGQSGSYQLCYHFTWAGCPSLLGCADTDCTSLLQFLLPVHNVVKRTMMFSYNVWIKSQRSLWYCSPKRPEKLYLVAGIYKRITSKVTVTWIQLFSSCHTCTGPT